MSTFLFLLKKLVGVFLLPPLLPIWITAVGLLLMRRRPRTGRVFAWGGLLIALLTCTPGSVRLLLDRLESTPPVTAEAARTAQAIVILGGGKQRYAPEYGGPTVNGLTLARVRYGALLARRLDLPILISGGAPSGNEPEADLMREVLEREYGLHPKWVENASRDTSENARFSARMLREAGVQRVLLVTHAAHMNRALREFADEGLTIVPAPTAWLASRDDAPPGNEDAVAELPTATAAYAGWIALHEWAGRLLQIVSGGATVSAQPPAHQALNEVAAEGRRN